jgi:DNA-binding transcriptional LysR family regulator
MAITLAGLRVFVEVADLGNIRDAALKLGRTPSAVSMALKQLEAEVGGPLFESDRKTKLSPLGRYVMSVAKPEVMGFDRAISAIRAFARTEAGRLELACVPSIASSLLPTVVRRFAEAYPGVEIDLRDADSETVAREVVAESVELGIASEPMRPLPLGYRPLFRDPFVLVCRDGHPLAGAGPLDWDRLEGQPLIVNGSSRRIDRPEHRAMATDARLLVRNVLSLLAMVRDGVGVTLLPRMAVPDGFAGVACVPLADPGCRREVGLLTRSGQSTSPAAATFVALLQAVLAEQAAADRLRGIELAGGPCAPLPYASD